MDRIGIVCEYNPLHLGHQKQFRMIREQFGTDCAIICVMSGAFVQRGAPAVFDAERRAKAAILSGADLVLELPVTHVLSSAEGFAAGAVRILSQFCDTLCFGTETLSAQELKMLAQALLTPAFTVHLRDALTTGCSFPAARQLALEQMGVGCRSLSGPNDILALEYCKAILAQNSKLEVFPVFRQGSYHATLPDPENPSATALRRCIEGGEDWQDYIPQEARVCFANAAVHTLAAGERAMLYKLRTMEDAEFERLPFGSEGLWRKLMHASRSHNTLEEILNATKSKRYTRSRLNRMAMCAFLGSEEADLSAPAPYTRVLAFNNRGRQVLQQVKDRVPILNAGASSKEPYFALEKRCADLYGLFTLGLPEPPGTARTQRIYYHREETK